MKKIINFLIFFLMFFNPLYASKDTLEIGFVYWKKDGSPQKYNAYLYGIKKAIDEYSNKNKIDISVVDFNDKGDINESIKIAKEIAKRDNMIAVIGFSNSKRAIKSIKFVSEKDIPIISSAGSLDIFKNDVNNSFYTTNFGIQGEIEYLKNFITSNGYTNIVFIGNKNDDYSNEYFNEVNKIIKQTKHFSLSNLNNEKLIKNIDKDTLVIISIDVMQNAKLSKQLRELGIQNDIFLGRGGIVGDEFYKNGGYGLQNIYELSTLLAGVSNESLLKFKLKNKSYFDNKENEPYLEYAVYGYDVANLILNAYYRANKNNETLDNDTKQIRKMIKDGLNTMNEQNPYDGVAITYSFNQNRVGGKLIPQYILKTNGKKPTLYKKQYIYQNGVLKYVPSLYTNIDIKSISIKNQEVNQYAIEMILTLISEDNITLDDIEFENIMINESSFQPSIYTKEFLISQQHNDFNRKVYKIKAQFEVDSHIRDFPFDSHELPILIKPKNPVDKNFINIFISDFDSNSNNIEISGWDIKGGYSGFKKGNYEYINDNFEKQKEYYYRSSFTIDIQRDAVGSAVKFILPLAIVFFISLMLFAMPDNAIGDKVGASTNMLITTAALYFTYATLVDVDYLTFVDWLYMGSLIFILLENSIFIVGQRFYVDRCQIKNTYKRVYYLSFIVSSISFISAIIYFINKVNFN